MNTYRIRHAQRNVKLPVPREHQEATAFMDMVRLHEHAHPDLRWLFAVPNGGYRNPITAKKMRAEGCRPGVYDYCWPLRTQRYPGLFLELKRLTGKPSPEQVEFGAWAAAQGYRVAVCKGWIEAWGCVCEYGGIAFKVQS